MNHASLFSGIGGFDLAAEQVGWKNVFNCEVNEFAKKVLKHYWPNAIQYDDIKRTNFTVHRGTIDVLTGGFPCQPYSLAGKRLGKEDDRHLWPEMLRVIREVQPTWVVGENVFGLVNWNGGLVFNEVQTDLEAEGYEVQPYVLPACGVNAPHKRDRVWFVAHTLGEQLRGAGRKREEEDKAFWDELLKLVERSCEKSPTPDPTSQRGKRVRSDEPGSCEQEQREFRGGCSENDTESTANYWQYFPTQPPVCDGNDGISSRLAGITFSNWRNESIKAMGNAIVPQVAIEIFKAIQKYEFI